MLTATVSLSSLSPYSPSRRVEERLPKEPWDDYEKRVWKDRAHYNPDGHVIIPPMAFKRSIEAAAKFLRMRIPGKDRSEFGKHFVAGVLVPTCLALPITRDTLEGESLYLSSRGIRGDMDVLKIEPCIREWSGTVTYYILDETITKDVFMKHLTEAGNFIGIGRFRPMNGGYYGRYSVLKTEWS